jgi:hypothetical protein
VSIGPSTEPSRRLPSASPTPDTGGTSRLSLEYLDGVERGAAEFRRFLACGGRVELDVNELNESARILVVDVPRLINDCRPMMAQRPNA